MIPFNKPCPDEFNPLEVFVDVPACDRAIRICQKALRDRPDMPLVALQTYTELIQIAEKQKYDLEHQCIDGEIIL